MASIGDLPAALFSPSKLVCLAYVILIGLKILSAPRPQIRHFLG
jgi:threonine/homoserine/homoserine lactone efflux protein